MRTARPSRWGHSVSPPPTPPDGGGVPNREQPPANRGGELIREQTAKQLIGGAPPPQTPYAPFPSLHFFWVDVRRASVLGMALGCPRRWCWQPPPSWSRPSSPGSLPTATDVGLGVGVAAAMRADVVACGESGGRLPHPASGRPPSALDVGADARRVNGSCGRGGTPPADGPTRAGVWQRWRCDTRVSGAAGWRCGGAPRRGEPPLLSSPWPQPAPVRATATAATAAPADKLGGCGDRQQFVFSS